MSDLKPRPARIFYSYSHHDIRFRHRLETALASLRRRELIVEWHDRNISAGEEWKTSIDANLEAADIILLLISFDFVASEYCYSIEMMRSMEKHDAGEARVIPIIVGPADFQELPFGRLQVLPTGARPVRTWPIQDQAWLDVALGIRTTVETLDLAKLAATRAINILAKEHSWHPIGVVESAAKSERHTTGYYQRFQEGPIYWSERGGAHSIWGAIGALFENLGSTGGRLGFPLSDDLPAFKSPQDTVGTFQRFEDLADYPEPIGSPPVRCGGTIYWSEATGAHATWGRLGEAYERLGGTSSPLGFPTSPERKALQSPFGSTGWCQDFQGGVLYYSDQYGGFPVSGPILDLYTL